MPELPEVETVRLGLVPVLEGHRLVHVDARRADLRVPFPRGFARRLTGGASCGGFGGGRNISSPISMTARR